MTLRRRLRPISIGAALLGARIVAPQSVSPPPQSPPIVIDSFDNVRAWKAMPSDGVSLGIASDRGKTGAAMRLDFDFHGGAGYAVAHRAVSLDLPVNYEISFDVRGTAPSENVEVKLIDQSGDNVWWLNRRDYVFSEQWKHFTVKRRQISFAWGPRGGGVLKHAAAFEISITAGSGGKGSVWIDNLVLTPRPPVSPHPPHLRASATNSASDFPPANAVDGDTSTLWRSRNTGQTTLTVDMGAEREFGGVTVLWDSTSRPRSYDVLASDDGREWKTVYQLRNGTGARDDLYMPESESRLLRLELPASHAASHSAGFGIREIEIRPLAWSESLNSFYFAVAKGAPRGSYPRAFTDSVQTYWTIVGAPAALHNVLVGEDGAVEAGASNFSLEPFLYEDGRLMSWADAHSTQTLEHGDLPIPSIHWTFTGEAAPVSLTTTAVVAGTASSATLYVRYRLSNSGPSARRVTLFVAMRPFQVNGPFQFLNSPGGAASLRSIRIEGGTVRTTGVSAAAGQRVIPLTPPTSFGASTFDAGGVVRDMRTGRLPSARLASDTSGRADAALSYSLDLAPGSSRDVVIAAPVSSHSLQRPTTAEAADRIFARALHTTATEWESRLATVSMHLPPDADWLVHTLRTQQADILMDQKGPAIQPGSRSYDRSWIRDGALISEALLRTGHSGRVHAFLDWYAPFQFANGKIPCCVDHRGADPVSEHDSDGEFLYLVHQLYRFTGDTSVLRKMWPRVTLAVSYLDSLRHVERVPANRTPSTLQFYGLLPPSISHEGYSAKPMHSYWDDFWALRGFRDATAIAEALGMPDSSNFESISRQFETDLLASINAAMQVHHIDFIPGAADLGDFDATSTTIALEPGGEQTVLPEPALRRTFDRYWENATARETGDKQWTDYTPYELRIVGTFVRLGEADRAHSLLQFFRKGQRPAGWFQWAEVVRRDPRAPGFVGDMPHAWVGSDFIRSLLDMFVYDREREHMLVVGAGISEAWVRSPNGVTVSGVVTPYGSLTVREVAGGSSVRISVSGLTRMPPGGIAVHAPFPMKPVRASVNGSVVPLAPNGTVIVRQLPATIEFSK